jgi:type II secretory ATPase GspE/PulE/Tfp pilus assembly ATPase PilB-like protein
VFLDERTWKNFSAFLLKDEVTGPLIKNNYEKYRRTSFPIAEFLHLSPGLEDRLLALMRMFTQLPIVFLPLSPPNKEALAFFTMEQIERLDILPLSCIPEKNELQIALFDPFNADKLRYIHNATHMNLKLFLAPLSQIRKIVYGLQGNKEGEVSLSSPNSVVCFVDSIIEKALTCRASDIHVEPFADFSRIRYRVDGCCYPTYVFSPDFHPSVISRIKLLASMDIAEKRLPQDGRFCLHPSLSMPIDVRVSSLPTLYGEKLVLRLLDPSASPENIEKLGLGSSELDQLRNILNKGEGMFLVTGPTGSGKSTTLHALIDEMNADVLNITTVEDPVERTHEGVTQVQVDEKTGRSFHSVLRSILRQDPDVIMVGEIRDPETAQLAMRAALTGHFVLSSLHTEDAASAPLRLMEMGVPPFLVVSALKAVLSQRLIRLLCPYCKAVLSDIGVGKKYTARGCHYCQGTGYKGRTGVFELMFITQNIRRLLLQEEPTQLLRVQAKKEGMKTLSENAMEKVYLGETSVEEISLL